MGEPAPAPRLLSIREAAAMISQELPPTSFQRTADRYGTPYHKIGRQRFYRPDDIHALIERTRLCPDARQAHDYGGAEANGPLHGQTVMEARTSVEQARQTANKLKRRLPNS